MPDHEFEKNIQEKMVEFRLRPSEPVWDKVEQQLNKKDKRRRGLLWLPFLLAAAVGIYFISGHRMNSNTEPQIINHPQKEKSLAKVDRKIKETIDVEVLTPPDGVIKDPLIAKDTAAEMRKPDQHHTLKSLPSTTQMKSLPVTVSPANTPAITSLTPGDTRAHRRINEGVPSKTEENRTSVKVSSTPAPATGQPAAGESSYVPAGNISNSDLRQTRPVQPARVQSNPEQTFHINIAAPLTVPQLPEKTWRGASRKSNPVEFGLTFSIGRSHVSNGKLSNLFVNQLALESILDRSAAFQSGNPTPNPQPLPVKPSRLRAGVAITAGGYVKKQVTRKIRLSAGMNYKLFTTSHTFGTAKDTLITTNSSNAQMDMLNKVYTPGNTESYSNRFLFLEFPVTAEGRFINGKVPLFWNAGLSYSRLIASNALHYDNHRGIYYKNNKFLQKNQFSVHAAITTTLLTNTRNPLMVGPEFSYGLSDLLKYKDNDPNHFFYLGLKTSIALMNK